MTKMKRLTLYVFLSSLLMISFGCKDPIQIEDKPQTYSPSPEKDISDTPQVPDNSEVSIGRVFWQKPSLVIDKMGDLTGKTVADIGAELGFFAFRLPYKAEKVIAIDIDPLMIQHMNAISMNHPRSEMRERFEARLAKPDDPQLLENEVDQVIMINLIAYLGDQLAYLKNLRKAIKPGGMIMIVDFKMQRLPTTLALPKSERVYIDVAEELLYEAGYTYVVVDDTSLDYQYIITAINEK